MLAVIYLARTHNAADGSSTKRTRVVECVIVLVLFGAALGVRLVRGARTAGQSRGHCATCVGGYSDLARRVR